MSAGKSRYQVPNLERAMKILEFLSRSPKVTKAEIARTLDYPNNSVFRIVSTLEDFGYVTRNDSQEYSLTRKLLSLGYAALVESNLVELSAEALRVLAAETRETALLGVLLDGEGVVLEQELSPEPVKFMVSPGTRFVLHTAAPAKAILAFMSEEERNRQISMIEFSRITKNTITSEKSFRKELDKVRKQGYATDTGEQVESVNCVSAPIFDYRGLPRAAIWVTGPEFRLQPKSLSAVAKQVIARAAELSKQLGYEQ